MIIEELKKLYITHTGHEPEAIDELPSSGSNRRYFRLKGTPTLIGVSGESVEENRAFLYMAEHFRGKGLPVPGSVYPFRRQYLLFAGRFRRYASVQRHRKRTQDKRIR